VTVIHPLKQNWLVLIDPSSVAAITAVAQGPCGVQGLWHSAKVPPPTNGLASTSSIRCKSQTTGKSILEENKNEAFKMYLD